MKAEHEQKLRTYQHRARQQTREIIVTCVLTVVALGFVLAALLAPGPGMPEQTGALPGRIDGKR